MKTRWTRRVIPSLAVILVSSVAIVRAQWAPTTQIRALLDKTSVHRLVEGDPPVTTNLDDALTGIDFLDRYKPSQFKPLHAQRQDGSGAFHVGPGAYDFTAESYCLHAGTYGPGGGDGYVSAPLEGSRRDAVQHVLQNAVVHPEIPQQDIQVLLWAIVARTRISDMPRKTQITAARLLTPAELVQLNGGAIGMVTDRAWGETGQALPPAIQRAVEVETRLRQMLTTVDTSFEEIERFAVLGGDPAPHSASRKIPEGRWSYHREGYFIRFFPSGYSETEVHVFVPEPMTLVRNSAGRIAALVDQRGTRFDVSDDDRVANRRPTATRQAAAWRALLERPTSAGADSANAPRDMRDLEDLAQLHAGLEAANAGRNQANTDGLSPALDWIARAWAAEFCVQAGGCARGGSTGPRQMLTHTVDLSETVAVPGHRARQRLGLSGRQR